MGLQGRSAAFTRGHRRQRSRKPDPRRDRERRRPARPGRCRGRAGRRARRRTSRPPSGPESSAALESVSASSAVSPSAVAPTSPVQAGSPVAGSSRWWAKRPVGAAPDPHVEPRGGDAAGAEPQHVGALAGERVLDEDLVGVDQRVGAADADVAAAVDDEARVAAQALGDHVGGEALAGAAGVEAQARRADDLPGRVVDLELAPAALGVAAGPGAAPAPRRAPSPAARRPSRPARRRSRPPRSRRPGSGRRGRRCARPPQSPAATARAQQRRGRHPLARVGVQRAELAVGLEARERRVEVLDEAPAPARRPPRPAPSPGPARRSAAGRGCPSRRR